MLLNIDACACLAQMYYHSLAQGFNSIPFAKASIPNCVEQLYVNNSMCRYTVYITNGGGGGGTAISIPMYSSRHYSQQT